MSVANEAVEIQFVLVKQDCRSESTGAERLLFMQAAYKL